MQYLKLVPQVCFLIFLGIQSTFAQSQDSISGTPDFMGYESIPILCNATPYFATTNGSSASSQPTGFCESIENDEFICFQTGNSTEVVFEFSLLSCAGSGTGIEVGVLDRNGDAVGSCIIVDNTAVSERLELIGLEQRTEYCLRVDGIQGSNCDYTFEAISGITNSAPRQPEILESLLGPYCFGDTIGMSVIRIPNSAGYLWETFTTNTVSGLHYLDIQSQRLSGVSNDSIVSLVIPPYDITRTPGGCDTIWSYVTAYNACGESAPSPERAIVICTSVVDTVEISVCGGDSLGVEYPAGSGNFYYDNGGTYQSAPLPNGDCNELTAVLIKEGTGTAPVLEVDTTVCFFPAVIQGETIMSEGVYTFYLPIANAACDSVITYTVRSPSAQGAALNNPYCTNEFVRVGNSPWDNNFTYRWTDSQNNLAGITPNDYLNQFAEPGIYTLTVAHLGCDYTIEVIVEEAPALEFDINGDLLTIVGLGGADSVALYINNVFEVGNPSEISFQGLSNYTDSTSFRACAISDCGSTCELIPIEGTSSSQEFSSISELQVWPNPSRGIVHLQIADGVEQFAELYNSMGQVVLSTRLNSRGQLDLSTLPAGVFVLVLRDIESGLPLAREQIVKQ